MNTYHRAGAIRFCCLALLPFFSLLLPPLVNAQDAVRVSTIPQAEIIALASADGLLYAASYTLVYRSADGGDTWTPAAALPQDTSDLTTLLAHDGTLYAGTVESGVFASRDGGASWVSYSTGLTGLAERITAFAVRGDSLYAGTDGAGVYVLNLQNPAGWQPFRLNLPAQGISNLAVSGTTLIASGGISGSVYIHAPQATGWTTVPLDVQDPQNQVLAFLPSAPYILAGTAKGIYRSRMGADAWYPLENSLPASSDVIALTTYGARIYAVIQQQGFFIYSSDDQGSSWNWTLRSQEPFPVFDLLGSHGRLWLGRADGLWYYDLSSSPAVFQTSFTGEIQGQPVNKGSMLATLEGNELHLTGFFYRLTAPWIQMDLYRGDPRTTGEAIHNLGIAVPEGGGYRGGLDTKVSLTDAQVQDLQEGHLYFSIRTIGSRSEDLSGQIHVLPLDDPRFLETSVYYIRRGGLTRRGIVRATLEQNNLRLIGFGNLDASAHQIALYRGAVGTPGEHLATIWLNYTGDLETSIGFDHTLPLTEPLQQDLLDGLLYVEIAMAGDINARSRLLLAPNQAPAASQITAPAEGTTLLIGGTDGADPLDPETLLAEVTFTTAQDPDGSPVAYIWQVSRTPSFDESVTVAFDLGPDSTTLPLTVADVASIFDTISMRQPGNIALHMPLTVYHRVITTDEGRYTLGPAATMTFVRGTITSNEAEDDLPGAFTLHGNYPNPFNPSTTITFDLPAQADVAVEVYDVVGRQVRALSPRAMAAGAGRQIELDAASLASGLYLYRVVARTASAVLIDTGRMTLLR